MNEIWKSKIKQQKLLPRKWLVEQQELRTGQTVAIGLYCIVGTCANAQNEHSKEAEQRDERVQTFKQHHIKIKHSRTQVQ
jgi:hypothetical protein